MSTDASTAAREEDLADDAVTDYDGMLADLDVAIAEAKRKIENGRIRDEAKEKARCSQWRTLGYLINVRRQVANDRDLQDLAEEVEALKSKYEEDTGL